MKAAPRGAWARGDLERVIFEILEIAENELPAAAFDFGPAAGRIAASILTCRAGQLGLP